MPIIYAETRVTHSTARACDADDDQRDNQAVFFYQRSRVQHSLAKCRKLYRANDEGSIPCQGYDSDYTIHLQLCRRITLYVLGKGSVLCDDGRLAWARFCRAPIPPSSTSPGLGGPFIGLCGHCVRHGYHITSGPAVTTGRSSHFPHQAGPNMPPTLPGSGITQQRPVS